ncbi:MAG: ABC transporter permease [Candidatus Zixiibacteriota bacterium]
MLREYKIKKKGLLNRILILKDKGILRIAFGMLIFLLIVVGALYCNSYAKKFGRSYLRLGREYRPPEIGLFNKIFNHTEGRSPAPPTGKDVSQIQKKRSQESPKIHQYYEEDDIYPEEGGTADTKVGSFETHPLGTDGDGWDILGRLLAGCRVALLSGIMAVTLTLLLGTAFGIFSGYLSQEAVFPFLRSIFLRKRRVVERELSSIHFGDLANLFPTMLNIFPRLVLVVVILSLWKEINIWSVVIAIGIINVPKVSYIIKDKIEHLKNQEFIEAARELGVSHSQIIFKHILWCNCKSIILVQMAFIFAEVILVESSLSYLGHGLSDSWGRMVASESGLILNPSGIYWPFFFPAAAIVLTIIAFHALGDGLSRCFQIKG